jgi:predicted  nucleic acid-binding Zn-ribbon protein
MHESLKALLKLQEIDSEMIFLREARMKRPQELESDRRRVEERKKMVEAVVQEIKKIRMESDRRELDLRKNEAEVVKLRTALNLAKSNQEYQILKDQIGRLEEQDSKIEEEILKRLSEVDGLDRAKKEAEAELVAATGDFKKKEEELSQIVRGLDEQIAALNRQREEASRAVPNEHLQLYDRVLRRHKDFALARMENRVCQGCFMSVPPQTLNMVMLGRDLSQCGNCLRILYLE